MSEMIELVARAIWRVRNRGYVTSSVEDASWEECADEARAAIEAMVEPTSEMSTAGKHAVKGCESTFERDIAECAYRVMIRAGLSGASR